VKVAEDRLLRPAALEIRRSVDVVVARTGEGEILRQDGADHILAVVEIGGVEMTDGLFSGCAHVAHGNLLGLTDCIMQSVTF